MTYINGTADAYDAGHPKPDEHETDRRQALVLVLEDETHLSDAFRRVCECLNVSVKGMPTRDNLADALIAYQPMAVVAEMDAEGQDGCHVLMTVAAYDRNLPVLLITGGDPVLIGAVEAVAEVWDLPAVTKWPNLLGVGGLVDFLFRAGRSGRCMRLMSV